MNASAFAALTPIQKQAVVGYYSTLASVPAAQKALTGIVSDSMCGAHDMAKDKSPVECTRMCVKQGMKYALVAGQQDLHAGRT